MKINDAPEPGPLQTWLQGADGRMVCSRWLAWWRRARLSSPPSYLAAVGTTCEQCRVWRLGGQVRIANWLSTVDWFYIWLASRRSQSWQVQAHSRLDLHRGGRQVTIQACSGYGPETGSQLVTRPTTTTGGSKLTFAAAVVPPLANLPLLTTRSSKGDQYYSGNNSRTGTDTAHNTHPTTFSSIHGRVGDLKSLHSHLKVLFWVFSTDCRVLGPLLT